MLPPGSTFVALFGAQQSVMESVMLKRRIMGPGWLHLHQPRRIDASLQVCFLVISGSTISSHATNLTHNSLHDMMTI